MRLTRWALPIFLIALIYTIWDFRNQKLFIPVEEGASVRHVIFAPYDRYAVYFFVGQVLDDSSHVTARHLNAADPIVAQWRVSNVLGDTLAEFEGTTGSWEVGGGSRGPLPDGVLIFPPVWRTDFFASPFTPRVLHISVESLGAFSTSPTYLTLSGERDDGYSLYIIVYILGVVLLGFMAVVAWLVDGVRLRRGKIKSL